MSGKTRKIPLAPKRPLLLLGYAALCLTLSLTGQYLCESASYSALPYPLACALAGWGQLSFLLFGVFLYRLDTAPMRAERRASLLYFGRFATAAGFLVTVGEGKVQTLFWSVMLLFCLFLLMQNALSRGEKDGLLCLPSALAVIAAAVVTLTAG